MYLYITQVGGSSGSASVRRRVLPAVNVLHISESDGIGGSGRSAFRLHSSLRGLGLGSRMLVGRRRTDDRDVRLLKRSIAWRALDRASGELLDLLNLQYVFYP